MPQYLLKAGNYWGLKDTVVALAKGTAWAAALADREGGAPTAHLCQSLHHRKWDLGLKRIVPLTQDCSPTVAFNAQKSSCPVPTPSLLLGPH